MKKLVRRGSANISVTAEGRGHDKGREASRSKADHVPVFSADDHPAECGVTLGYRTSANYQSVNVSVTVKVPWDPNDIQAGLAYAGQQADQYLAENAEFVQAALDELSQRSR